MRPTARLVSLLLITSDVADSGYSTDRLDSDLGGLRSSPPVKEIAILQSQGYPAGVKRKAPRSLAVDPKVLASPLRAEIIGHLQAEGPLAVRELAAHLSRPADGLYHHIRLLLRAGLLCEKERRMSGRREEAVYALVSPRVASGDARRPERRAGLIAAAQTALRLAGREFAAALEACPPGKRPPFLRLSRQRVWLSDGALRKAQRLIGRLEELLARENGRRQGRLHVVTTIIVPVVKRR